MSIKSIFQFIASIDKTNIGSILQFLMEIL